MKSAYCPKCNRMHDILLMECSPAHVCDVNCRKCDGCKSCLYVVGFKQDKKAADRGYPMFFCDSCGTNNFWD